MNKGQAREKLAIPGARMNAGLCCEHDEIIKGFPAENYFALAVAHSLVWAEYAAKDKPEFFKNAVAFLDSGEGEHLEAACKFAGRYGPGNLRLTLVGWWKIIDNDSVRKELPGLSKCAAEKLGTFQEDLYANAIQILHTSHTLNIGPWFFCCPFKIMAAHRPDLWACDDLDKIWMPLGSSVNRAISRMIKEHSAYTEGLTETLYSPEEPVVGSSLKSEMSSVIHVQGATKKIATDTQSRVLHINSGLYLYGKVKG